jgi:hypothetical protein
MQPVLSLGEIDVVDVLPVYPLGRAWVILAPAMILYAWSGGTWVNQGSVASIVGSPGANGSALTKPIAGSAQALVINAGAAVGLPGIPGNAIGAVVMMQADTLINEVVYLEDGTSPTATVFNMLRFGPGGESWLEVTSRDRMLGLRLKLLTDPESNGARATVTYFE